MYSNVCDHRNARKRSSNSEYETPNPTGRDDQPQYDVIQLGHIQPGADADHYHSLNPQTHGLQPQQHSSNSEYETPNPTGRDVQRSQYEHIQLGQIQPGPDVGQYVSLNPQRQGLEPQQPSSSNEYETPNPTRHDDQLSQYQNIPLGQIQPGPDADHYHSLSPETRGEQHQYDVIPRPQAAVPDYLDIIM